MSRKLDNYIFGLRLASQIKAGGEAKVKTLLPAVEQAFQKIKEVAQEDETDNAALSEIKRWLCDNRIFVGAQYESIKKDVSSFGRVTAKEDRPLMHFLMTSFVTANDAEMDEDKLISFLRGVGAVTFLAVNDFWIVPLMLRCALFEMIAKFSRPANHDESPLYVRRVAQSVTSLKELRSIDFDRVFSKASRTEEILSEDPAGIYEKMSVATKNRYRNNLKKIAKQRKISEEEVAKEILDKAVSEEKHIGFYLIHEQYFWKKALYFSLLSGLFALLFIATISFIGNWVYALFALPLLFEITRKTVDFAASKIVKPQILPAMDEEPPLPPQGSCLAVIVSLITSVSQIDTLISKLESHYRINQDEHIYFGILADYKDFMSPESLHDRELGNYAQRKIEMLNKKYPGDRFSLFIRKREFSKSEQTFMGRERKRGAVESLVSYLCGITEDFDTLYGNKNIHSKIKYLVTLDYDTIPTNDSIKLLICKMLHPLNKPIIDKKTNRVVNGFGILQPAMRWPFHIIPQSFIKKGLK
jgi:cyclic beta-1,2-glucan synthetase